MQNQLNELIDKYKTETISVDDLESDLVFLINTKFYYGPDNGFSIEEYNEKQTQLKKINLKVFDDESSGRTRVLGSEVLRNFSRYETYVADVLAMYQKYNKQIPSYPSYFWLRPIMYSKKANQEITFSWHDTFDEAQRILESLSGNIEGTLYSDLEQGWEVYAAKKGDKFIVWEDGFDQGGLVAAMTTKYEDMLVKFNKTMELTKQLQEKLNDRFGKLFAFK
ncbi:MAG TPA: hypothetical protein VL401_00075 [Alphaproteobacteria bacterium]|jgi:hypothetical protein|nr:hypothetical protein [Alphaproteobacteria bacterium]